MNQSTSTTGHLFQFNAAAGSRPAPVQPAARPAALIGSTLLILLITKIGLIFPMLSNAGTTLAVLAVWALSRQARRGWSDIGFRRPKSWPRTAALGAAVAVALQASALLITFPLLARFGIPTPDFSAYGAVKSSPLALIGWLVVSWTTAGFGEEIIWRGFLMPRIARLFGNRKAGWLIALLISSTLFGLIHYPQGITGVVMTGFAGFIYGLLFLSSGRNLWPAVIAHAMSDTIAFLLLCYGGPIIQAVGL